jgi:biopolymer transport protein ExbD
MRFGSGEKRGDASFDLTPMIDVILLLIVFFMLSSQFSRSDQMAVNLPPERGEHTAIEDNPAEVVLTIDDRGGLFTSQGAIQLGDLGKALGVRESGPPPGLKVYIRADRGAKARHLNALAQELSRLGVKNWNLGTEPGAAMDAGGSQ